MGLSLSPEIIRQKSYKVPSPSKTNSDTNHFLSLLRRFAGHVTQGEKLSKHEEEKLVKLADHCIRFLNMKAYGSYSYTQVLSLLTDMLKSTGIPQVGHKLPQGP